MKNDFLTLIKTRRSIRAYKPDAVPADVLARVLEAGTYAPSAMGRQSATIVAVETQAYRDRLTKLNAAVIGKDVDPYYGAPVIVVVLGDGESANYLADGSCVLENLMLAAHAEGLGTVWVNREREIFDSPDGKALLRDWGLPETLLCREKNRSVDVDDRLGQLRGSHVGVVIVLAAVGDPADRDGDSGAARLRKTGPSRNGRGRFSVASLFTERCACRSRRAWRPGPARARR